MEGDEAFEDGREPDDARGADLHLRTAIGGCSVTGGFVYRGPAIPALQGAYVFGDYCQGELRGLLVENGRLADERALGQIVPSLVSFGEDNTASSTPCRSTARLPDRTARTPGVTPTHPNVGALWSP